MRTVYLPDRNCLRRMKKAHVYRAIMKRQTATASTSAHGRSSAARANESDIRPIVANRGRVSK